jgi:hypothetical protein
MSLQSCLRRSYAYHFVSRSSKAFFNIASFMGTKFLERIDLATHRAQPCLRLNIHIYAQIICPHIMCVYSITSAYCHTDAGGTEFRCGRIMFNLDIVFSISDVLQTFSNSLSRVFSAAVCSARSPRRAVTFSSITTRIARPTCSKR